MRMSLVGPLLLSLVACVDNETLPPESPDLGRLTGKIFVATSEAAISLGDVTVTAIPEATITSFIRQKQDTAVQMISQREPELRAARDAVEASNAVMEAATKAASEAAIPANADFLECIRALKGYWACEAERARQVRQPIPPGSAERAKQLLSEHITLARLQAATNFFRTSDFYFDDLPAGIASAKTNSDGQFTLWIPRTGNFALAARATRQSAGDVVEFDWLVWVTLNGNSSAHVILSDNNVVTGESPDSLITLGSALPPAAPTSGGAVSR